MGELYICKNTNYLLKDFEAYCITNLFMGNSDQAAKVCSTSVMPRRVVVMQTSAEEFFVFHPDMRKLTVECGPHNTRYIVFKGTRKIELKPGCFAHSKYYSLISYKAYALNFTVIERENVWKPAKMLSDFTLDQMHFMLPDSPNQPLSVENLKQQYDAIQALQYGHPWRWNLGLSFAWPLIPIAIVLLIIWLCRSKVGQQFQYLPAPVVPTAPSQPNVVYHVGRSPDPRIQEEYPDLPPTYPDIHPLRRAMSQLSLQARNSRLCRSLSRQSLTKHMDDIKQGFKQAAEMATPSYVRKMARRMSGDQTSKTSGPDCAYGNQETELQEFRH